MTNVSLRLLVVEQLRRLAEQSQLDAVRAAESRLSAHAHEYLSGRGFAAASLKAREAGELGAAAELMRGARELRRAAEYLAATLVFRVAEDVERRLLDPHRVRSTRFVRRSVLARGDRRRKSKVV